jgi:hypothetical protein
MNTNKILNVSLVIAGLVVIAGIMGVRDSVMQLAIFPGYIAGIIAFCSFIAAIWLRANGMAPSRSTLRKVSRLKEHIPPGETWQPNWRMKIAIPVFIASAIAIASLWPGIPTKIHAISSSYYVAVLLVMTGGYLACYATLYLAGKVARKAFPSIITDNREAFVTWAIVVVGIGVTLYFPATRDVALGVAPLAVLAGWIREVDILRTGIPLKALMFLSSDIGTVAVSARSESSTIDADVDDEVNVGRLMSDPAYRMLHPCHPVSQAHSDDD